MFCISIQDSSARTNQFFILIAVFVFSLKKWKSVNSILDTAFSLLQIKIYLCFSSSFFTLPSPLILRYKFWQQILIYVPEILLGLQTLICRISDAVVVWNFQRVTTTLFGLQPFLWVDNFLEAIHIFYRKCLSITYPGLSSVCFFFGLSLTSLNPLFSNCLTRHP